RPAVAVWVRGAVGPGIAAGESPARPARVALLVGSGDSAAGRFAGAVEAVAAALQPDSRLFPAFAGPPLCPTLPALPGGAPGVLAGVAAEFELDARRAGPGARSGGDRAVPARRG